MQGGVDADLRRESAERLLEIGFPGYAIGGLSVGEDRERMLETTALTTALLPADRLRYFMGIGDPDGLLEVIARGVDIFDCVLPTRTARMGTAFTPEGGSTCATRSTLCRSSRWMPAVPARPAPASRGAPSGTSSCRRRSWGCSS